MDKLADNVSYKTKMHFELQFNLFEHLQLITLVSSSLCNFFFHFLIRTNVHQRLNEGVRTREGKMFYMSMRWVDCVCDDKDDTTNYESQFICAPE